MAYCTATDVKDYLGISNKDDDTLLGSLIVAAQQRIDAVCKRSFEATADAVRYYNPEYATCGRSLYFDQDLCHITSIVSDGTTIPSTEYKVVPRNITPWRKIELNLNSTYTWIWSTSPEDNIVVTGRWANMVRKPFTAIARATNVITATLTDTTGLFVGQSIYCAGVADTGFNGNFIVKTVTATTVTWTQTGTNDTDTSGAILFTPPDIRHACIRLTGWLYRQKDTQGGDADRPILAGDGSVLMPTTLPQDVQSILSTWVRINV